MKIEHFTVPGLDELDAILAKFETVVAFEVVEDAIRASAELLQEGWRREAPFNANSRPKSWTLKSGEVKSRDYGHLYQNIRVAGVVPEGKDHVVFKVTTGNAFWGYFLEFGTVNQPARPWARPILESLKGACLNVQVEVLRAGIARVVGKGVIASSGGGRKFGPMMANGRNS